MCLYHICVALLRYMLFCALFYVILSYSIVMRYIVICCYLFVLLYIVLFHMYMLCL